MRCAKRTRWCVTRVVVVSTLTALLAWHGAGKKASSAAEAAPDGATQQATVKPRPIPEAGQLASPADVQDEQLSRRLHSHTREKS